MDMVNVYALAGRIAHSSIFSKTASILAASVWQ